MVLERLAIDFLLTLLDMQHDDLIKKFEELLATNSRGFFDTDEFDILIDYYLTANQYQKALKAVDFALEQYPYSIDFFCPLQMTKSVEQITLNKEYFSIIILL